MLRQGGCVMGCSKREAHHKEGWRISVRGCWEGPTVGLDILLGDLGEGLRELGLAPDCRLDAVGTIFDWGS